MNDDISDDLSPLEKKFKIPDFLTPIDSLKEKKLHRRQEFISIVQRFARQRRHAPPFMLSDELFALVSSLYKNEVQYSDEMRPLTGVEKIQAKIANRMNIIVEHAIRR